MEDLKKNEKQIFFFKMKKLKVLKKMKKLIFC